MSALSHLRGLDNQKENGNNSYTSGFYEDCRWGERECEEFKTEATVGILGDGDFDDA